MRSQIQWFAEQMEAKLAVHDHKGGWEKCRFDYLANGIMREFWELSRVLFYVKADTVKQSFDNDTIDALVKECADVANFAMMIADNANTIKGELVVNRVKNCAVRKAMSFDFSEPEVAFVFKLDDRQYSYKVKIRHPESQDLDIASEIHDQLCAYLSQDFDEQQSRPLARYLTEQAIQANAIRC